jgi:hypothetical protein
VDEKLSARDGVLLLILFFYLIRGGSFFTVEDIFLSTLLEMEERKGKAV